MTPNEPTQSSDLPAASTLSPELTAAVSVPPPQIKGYEILGELAAAGQGRVWRARQLGTGRDVALKVPRVDLLRVRTALRRFEREVELAARLSHPNIAQIYDSGIHQGLYYFAMELIDGVWLDSYVKEHNLSLVQILRLMQVICDAIQHAHQNGVIHRDLKPSNILVTQDGQPHIVDFGLAVATVREHGADTVSLEGEVTGTPAYMSPEQVAGQRERVDTRTDVYTLGVVFYRLVTGSFPYDVSTSMLQTLQNIRARDPIRPSKLARRLDRDSEAIILKTLEKDPARRYQSVAELKGDIERRLADMPVLARSDSSLYLLRKIVAKHRYATTVAALLLATVLGFLGFSIQLYTQLRGANRDLTAQRELSNEQAADFTRIAQEVILGKFLEAWHKDDRQAAATFARSFREGTREAIAVQFLQDQRPLSSKTDEFRQKLQQREPEFIEFILAEHYLKNGDRQAAASSYRVCLARQDLEQRDPWRAMWIKRRLFELADGARSISTPAESEAKTP
jgi:serine/threonine protein kinase